MKYSSITFSCLRYSIFTSQPLETKLQSDEQTREQQLDSNEETREKSYGETKLESRGQSYGGTQSQKVMKKTSYRTKLRRNGARTKRKN